MNVSLCLSHCKPNWFGIMEWKNEKTSVEPFPQPIIPYPRLPYFLTRAASRPGLSSCSPAYLAGAPEIIVRYSWQVSDKACRCSAGLLDGQICYDWGYICECNTVFFSLCNFHSSEQAQDWNWEGLHFLKHLNGWVPLISVFRCLMGREEHRRSLCSSAPHFSCYWLLQLKRGLLMYFSFFC